MKQKILEKITRYRFAAMIAAVVLLTILLTITSIWVYTHSGAINLDLSRPGYEKIREETTPAEPEIQFSPNGPIDKNVTEDFNARLESIQNELNSMNNFSSDVISDEALDLIERK